jgi:dipeptidyl aminopeptidase/acylaminoacyl peptidase
MQKKILLQTTIPPTSDDWSIARFGLLAEFLDSQTAPDGSRLFSVSARDRDAAGAPDTVLSKMDSSGFDELWLFAVDTGDGLTPEDCAAISRFRHRGGGLLVTRDHMDLGSSVCTLGGVGAAHHFHSKNPERDPLRRRIDDPFTTPILWPNYHSGANGDYQEITSEGELHPVLRDPRSPGRALRFLPAHPHEGAVSAPPGDESARVIAKGRSVVTGTDFNIAVAFEPFGNDGPAIAQSTFHHFADYNWDLRSGAPSFVTEKPGKGMAKNPKALESTKLYARNLAFWLGGVVG